MTSDLKTPFIPQDEWEVSRLVTGLEQGAKKSGRNSFKCKKSTFATSSRDGLTVDSWRFNDWDYKRTDLPTYARGLFTCKSPDGKAEIIIRGYDKFFNTEEVNKTRWRNVEINTRGPYELSVKENGCIVFLSGLAGDELLVCSKHSTGARQDASLSHAIAAERWIDHQLQKIGKTRTDLARELRSRNATAVGELCDDSFEEHILAYDASRAGIYLHGINLNLPTFTTYPGPLVDEFAEQWGFRKTQFLVKQDITETRAFLEGVAETGAWEGKDIEGFVIRCQARDGPEQPWHDWFFKYKFEEPYLMYRQWREVTKAMISGKQPRYKKHEQITQEYLLYAKQQLVKNPRLASEFQQNHGIIAMREGFLKERGLKGSEIIRQELENEGLSGANVTANVVLVPIATLGCGKTTLSVAMQRLFGWGHVQNDNVEGKKGRPQIFANQVRLALEVHPVVIADRNNHQKRERKQIIDDLATVIGIRLVALHFVHETEGASKQAAHSKIRQVTQDRVFARGDNHQTIHAQSKGHGEIAGIMEGFLKRFEPCDPHEPPDDGFDAVINLDPTKSSRENLETIVTELHTLYPRLWEEIPTGENLDDAIAFALSDYKPDKKHDLSFRSSKSGRSQQPSSTAPVVPEKPLKPTQVEYFGVFVPTMKILNGLEMTFLGKPPAMTRFFTQLRQTRRIQTSFHVTLAHRANVAQFPAQWEELNTMYTKSLASKSSIGNKALPTIGSCRVQMERCVWDDRVMCIVARLLDAFATTNTVAHITVGTAGPNVKPKESNDMLKKWLEKGTGEQSGIWELQFEGNEVVIDGEVKPVMSR